MPYLFFYLAYVQKKKSFIYQRYAVAVAAVAGRGKLKNVR